MNQLEDYNTREVRIEDPAKEVSLMRNVYLWMTLALAITAATAYLTISSETLFHLVYGNGILMIVLIVLELGLVIGLSAAINRMSMTVATTMFILYSFVNGLTLSSIFLTYEIGSIFAVFMVSAGMFGVMVFVGMFTKKDLSAWGKFGLMALIGMILAMVVNLFLHSEAMDYIVSAIGVLVFSGLTAYDSQKIKAMLDSADPADESTMKLALMGSLTLYLDFINLFLDLLRIFGKRK